MDIILAIRLLECAEALNCVRGSEAMNTSAFFAPHFFMHLLCARLFFFPKRVSNEKQAKTAATHSQTRRAIRRYEIHLRNT